MDTLHIMPQGDLTAHEPNDDCVCGPTAEAVMRVDGSCGWLAVHHALDGRS